jgi:hypothetical protein
MHEQAINHEEQTMTNSTWHDYLLNLPQLKHIDKAIILSFINENSQYIDEISAQHLFNILDNEKQNLLSDHYELMNNFMGRLFETWKSPIERLDSLIYMCTETTDRIRTLNTRDATNITAKLNITTRLHARAMLVAREVSHLLHGGFADGALARWRTLHETAVILKFLSEGDEILSERFIDYQNIRRLEGANRYNDNNDLGFESFTTSQIEEFKQAHKETLEKYEPKFANKLGWALNALGENNTPKKKADFIDIEKFVGLSFLRNHYSFANQYIHAGVDSIGYKLGTSMSNKDLLLAGPSNEGLLEPIQCTSLSVCHATIALISAFPDHEGLLQTSVFWMWHEALKSEAVKASDGLQKKGDALRA